MAAQTTPVRLNLGSSRKDVLLGITMNSAPLSPTPLEKCVMERALRLILTEATGVKYISPKTKPLGAELAKQAALAISQLERKDGAGFASTISRLKELSQLMSLIRSAVVTPYARVIHNALSTISQQQKNQTDQDHRSHKMKKINVSLEIDSKSSGFASEQAMLDWIHACLNCNVNNTEVKVAMATPAPFSDRQIDPRVLVVVNGGVAETYSDDGIDIVIFDFDNFNCREEEAGDPGASVPFRFEDLAIQANVPVEASPSSATDQPQG